MICKDCMSYEVCINATDPNPEYTKEIEDVSETCIYFKNKADFVSVEKYDDLYSKYCLLAKATKEEIKERKEMDCITIEITKFQAEAMCDFLEAEFINGIGSDKDVKDNEYVKNIKAVYDKLQEVCGK